MSKLVELMEKSDPALKVDFLAPCDGVDAFLGVKKNFRNFKLFIFYVRTW